MAEVGSVVVARGAQVYTLRAANKRLAQELDILKTLGQQLLELQYHPADPVSTYQNIARRAG